MIRRAFPTLLLYALSAAAAPVTPFSTATGATLPAPWQIVTLPKIPRHTQYTLAQIDGRLVVRAEADASYANVLHPIGEDVSATPVLRFAWRVDRFPAGSDLRTRSGDDLAAKVCVLFDVPLDRLSFFDRLRIEFGRRLFDSRLPSATICYAWDRELPSGTWIPNAYTNRVRMLVLRSAASGEQARWFDERRDLRADFVQAFPGEGDSLPRVVALGFATDADNTGSSALALFGDIALSAE
jgi:Protein of unknown function (DUF3047)